MPFSSTTLLRAQPLDHLEMTAEDSEMEWTVAVAVRFYEGGAILGVQQLDNFEVSAESSVVHCGAAGDMVGWEHCFCQVSKRGRCTLTFLRKSVFFFNRPGAVVSSGTRSEATRR